MYWKFHSRHSWVSPLFTCQKSQWTKTEYIQNKDVLLIHWTETWRSKEKQEVLHCSSPFTNFHSVVRDHSRPDVGPSFSVTLRRSLKFCLQSYYTLISDSLVTRVKTHQLKLIDLFLQLQEKKKSDKRDNLIT